VVLLRGWDWAEVHTRSLKVAAGEYMLMRALVVDDEARGIR
jgi:hypothetical protein